MTTPADDEMAPVETIDDAAVVGNNSVPDEAVVSLLDAVSHALGGDGAQQPQPQPQQHEPQQQQQPQLLGQGPPPPPLPAGWVMKESRAQPNYFYYFNMDTGESTWFSPVVPEQQQLDPQLLSATNTDPLSLEDGGGAATPNLSAEKIADKLAEASKKRSHEGGGGGGGGGAAITSETVSKKSKTGSKPSKVRILHILKKHKGSRRPSSWRQPKITATKEEAIEELEGLIEILKEESGEAQRATFEELARTESDCSSAKRGGDLGFFGPKKMQPPFEEASFALEIGEMSGIIETSSGVHVLLRIG